MMDEILRSGLNPEAGQALVLRVKLRTFTLGHYFLLQEIESPFFEDTKPIEISDLLRAVLICSQTYPKARASLRPKKTTLLFVYLLAVLNRKSNLAKESAKFLQYLRDNRRMPAARRPAGGRSRNAPEPWRLLAMLLRDFSMSLAEAMDTTVRQANCLWTVSAELDGGLQLMPFDPLNTERLRILRETAAARAAAAARQTAN